MPLGCLYGAVCRRREIGAITIHGTRMIRYPYPAGTASISGRVQPHSIVSTICEVQEKSVWIVDNTKALCCCVTRYLLTVTVVSREQKVTERCQAPDLRREGTWQQRSVNI